MKQGHAAGTADTLALAGKDKSTTLVCSSWDLLPFPSSSKIQETIRLPSTAEKKRNEWNFALLSEPRQGMKVRKKGRQAVCGWQIQRRASGSLRCPWGII